MSQPTVEILFPGKEPIPADCRTFVNDHPQSTWFHRQALEGCLLQPALFVPVWFVLRKHQMIAGIITATHMLNNGSVSSAAVHSRIQSNGSPLLQDNPESNGSILTPLLNQALHYASDNAAVMEFRNSVNTGASTETWLKSGFHWSDHLNLIKPIDTEEHLWLELGENRRRQIRRATANGTVVRPAASDAEVRSWYEILHHLYTTKVRKLLPPVEFFLDFYTNCQQQNKGVILLALSEDQVIGGIVCPIQHPQTMYEWYICGKDKEYPHHHPSVMVTWHALLWACHHGIRAFDFMGIGKPGIPYGVRDFKLRFGGQIVNHGRYTKSFIENRNP